MEYEIQYSDGVEALSTVEAAQQHCREDSVSADVIDDAGRVIARIGRDGLVVE